MVRLLVLGTLLAAAACAPRGIVHDGSSVSYGPSNAGVLLNPRALPLRGSGYVVPAKWRKRGLLFGTDEAVGLVVYAAARVKSARPGATLGVADLSPKRGGPSAWHRSHQTGRDVHLIFYALDSKGRSVKPERMVRYGHDGREQLAEGDSETAEDQRLRFDVPRNWLLVKALVDNPVADVQFVFMADWLKQSLIDHAVAIGEQSAVVEKASYLLHQPGDSLPHDDHIHLRIYCSRSDVDLGCNDRGGYRWLKKDRKYKYRQTIARATRPVLDALGAPLQALLALSAVPFPGFGLI